MNIPTPALIGLVLILGVVVMIIIRRAWGQSGGDGHDSLGSNDSTHAGGGD